MDESRADDVVQQTFITALTRPPRSVASLRAWLARVARNFAYRTFREEGRRTRREKAVARPEGTPSTGDLVSRLSMHRQVVDAVLTLDEPFRTTVLLRYYEDLSPAEIANRTGVAESTVRTRLHRAREKLRARLDDAHRGRRDIWRAGLLPFAFGAEHALPKTAAGGAAALAGGALLMKKFAIGLVAAGMLAMLALFLVPRGDAPPLPEKLIVADRGMGREDSALTGENRSGEAAGHSIVFGTVVRSGRPAPARIEIRRIGSVGRSGWAGPGYRYDDLLAGIVSSPAPADAVVHTGADGRFEVAALLPGVYEVRAESPDGVRGSARVKVPLDGARVSVRVPLSVVRGLVTNRGTGEPAVGVEVWAKGITGRVQAGWHAVTDENGRYEIQDAPGGDIFVFAKGGGRVSPELADAASFGFNPLVVQVTPGEEAIANLTVIRASRAKGHVFDAAGTGIPGVLVQARDDSLRKGHGWRPDLSAGVTDADGAFQIEDLVAGVPYHFKTGSATGWCPSTGIFVPEPGETIEIEIRAEPFRRLTVKVIDELTGEPLVGVFVSFFRRGVGSVTSEFPTAPDGVVILREVPTSEISLSISDNGLIAADPFTVPAGNEDRTVEILRLRGGELKGRVRFRVTHPPSPLFGESLPLPRQALISIMMLFYCVSYQV